MRELLLVLMSDNVDALKAALAQVGKTKPLAVRRYRSERGCSGDLAKEFDCPLTVKAGKVGDVAKLSTKLMAKGLKDIVLDSGATQTG